MKVYSYDENGYLDGISEARLDPLESTKKKPVYLLPARATFTAPLEGKPGHWQRWTGKAWKSEPIPVAEVPAEPVSPESEPSEAELNAARDVQAKLMASQSAAIERIKSAKAKGLKPADCPKVLEDIISILWGV